MKKHRPLHVSLVGGEPMIRHRELSRILPALSAQNIFTMVVTSGIIPIPMEWMGLRRNRVAVSIDGLPEHHDPRRKPATYERILENIRDREVNIHWTITGPMMKRPGYLEEYLAFWQARPEVKRIWVSLYSSATGRTHSGNADHGRAATGGAGAARPAGGLSQVADESRHRDKRLLEPPKNPQECLFSKMSTNFSADLTTRVEPCIFGGTPDCSQCGCVVSSGLHHVQQRNVLGPLKIGHLVRGSTAIGSLMNRLRSGSVNPSRWSGLAQRHLVCARPGADRALGIRLALMLSSGRGRSLPRPLRPESLPGCWESVHRWCKSPGLA